MRTLTLPLKGEYFDAIKAGIKPEEFRAVTPYWRKRLEGRVYDQIELTRGYPLRGDTIRRLVLPWKGCRLTTITHPHFGPEPVEVFAINVEQQGVTVGGRTLDLGDWIECDVQNPSPRTLAAQLNTPEALAEGFRLLSDAASGWRRATRDWSARKSAAPATN